MSDGLVTITKAAEGGVVVICRSVLGLACIVELHIPTPNEYTQEERLALYLLQKA